MTFLLPVDTSLPVHMIGIGGDGMSSLAGLLLEAGYSVVGTQLAESDKVKQPILINELRHLGAEIHLGHDACHVGQRTALVIRSSAISDDHEEVLAARSRGITVAKRATVLGELTSRYKTCVAVAGTAGKTTTSAMVSHILMRSGFNPGFSIGSPLRGTYKKNYRLGDGTVFVVEADEYDRSFLSLSYKIAIITELFFGDHPDIYVDHHDLLSGFSAFVARIPETGKLIGFSDNADIRSLGQKISNQFASYGFGETNEHRIGDCVLSSSGSRFTISASMSENTVVNLKLPGRQNIANATGAIIAAKLVGVPMAAAADAISDFPGTARRFELVGVMPRGTIVYDDYAHNPQQIAATLSALRQVFPKERLACVFEPRQYRRTRAMLTEFPTSFARANHVIVLDISEGLGDLPEHKALVHSRDVVVALTQAGQRAEYGGARENALAYVRSLYPAPDVIVTMGTGRLAEFAIKLLE